MPAKPWSLKETPKMDDAQFARWQVLLDNRTGMQMPEQRKTFLETSVTMRMREIGLRNYDDYYTQLNSGVAGNVEWAILVDRLTVHETRFFRHPRSYDLVRDYTEIKLAESTESLSFDVWSVGCSTGEEPYSLAMVFDEIFAPQRTRNFFGITATDISLDSIATGRKGIYGARPVEELDPKYRDRYFKKLNNRQYQVIDTLRSRVCFAKVNVMEIEKAPMRDLDMIFCQNMLIYFDRKRQRQIVSQLIERLKPGGIIILGVGEVVDFSHPLAQRINDGETLAFERVNT